MRELEQKIRPNDAEETVRQYGPQVLRLAFVFVKNRFDAEDIAQDVFVTYLQRAPRFPSEEKKKAWLLTVTANRCRNFLRSWRRKTVPLPEDLSDLPPEEGTVLEAMLHLDAKYRSVLHLYYYEGYRLSEIGEILRCSTSTIGSRLARGREKLKQELEGYHEDL